MSLLDQTGLNQTMSLASSSAASQRALPEYKAATNIAITTSSMATTDNVVTTGTAATKYYYYQ